VLNSEHNIFKAFPKRNAFLLKNHGNIAFIIDITAENHAPRTRTLPIKYIVMHYLGVPNADNPYLYNGGYGGHYNVTRAGKIYKAVDPRKGVVWHCGGGLQGSGGHTFYGKCTNYNSIGIECGVCADTDAKDLSGDSYLWYFTEETQEAAAWLVSELMKEYNIDIDHVIRHYDVTGKCCPNPYVLNNRRKTSWTWEQFKARVKSYLEGAESVREGVYMTTFVNVHKGTNGADALTVQRLLFAQDYKGADGQALKLDGDFGANSEHALKMFQKYHGLTVDGDCGPATWAALLGK
jgi:N-acetyl-anhydromuramyl-L-alanine amidase AmpD